MKKRKFLLIILLIYGLVYIVSDYNRSFKSINEALYNEDSSSNFMQINQIIGGSEYGRKAFYFFLNKENNIVGVRLDKGIFGWKFNGSSTGTGLEIDIKQKLSKASTGALNDSNKFYFGLTSFNNIEKIIINNTYPATLINLEDSLTYDKDIPNTYLWYGHFKEESANYFVEVFDKQNNLIHSQ
ncbi:hypothetical protein ACFQZR_10270 [Paenibacillus sp. GCM10027629]|uniref:hypothetical protein n=1 Tax=Paenibacillus sp. GCM10027629 TaxID=3273414 RepID=UPI0036404745